VIASILLSIVARYAQIFSRGYWFLTSTDKSLLYEDACVTVDVLLCNNLNSEVECVNLKKEVIVPCSFFVLFLAILQHWNSVLDLEKQNKEVSRNKKN